MAEKQLIPVQGVDEVGIIRDVPAHALPPNAWSDGRNIYFKNSTVYKRQGTVRAFDEITDDDVEIAHLAYWPNPDQRVFIEVIRDLRTAGSPQYNLRALDQDGARHNVTLGTGAEIPITGLNSINDRDWNHTLFTGGHNIIFNTNRYPPAFVARTAADTFSAAPLPGWETTVPAVAGDPAQFTTARVVRGVGNRMFAGNFTFRLQNTDTTMQTTTGSYPGTLRISALAPAGAVPSTWDPNDLDNPGADEFELSNTSPIVEIVPLQGQAIVYTTTSIHSVSFQGLDAVVRNVADGYGALTTGAVLEFDGRHFVVGSNDLYVFGGHPGSIQSVSDHKVRDFFFSNINPLATVQENMFLVRDSERDEIQIYYPSVLSTNECDRYLAWNYRNNTWSINDTDDVITGVVGPIRGGGIANTDIRVDGNNRVTDPAANTVEPATAERQTVTIDSTLALDPITPEVQTLVASGTQAATFETEEFPIGIDDDIIPTNRAQSTHTFSGNSGTNSRNLGTVTGTTGNANSMNIGGVTGFNLTAVAAAGESTYTLTGVPAGSNIELVVGGITLTQFNLTTTFEDTDVTRTWSLTGTVPAVAHSGTTNANGTLRAGTGTSSTTNIGGFTGLNLTAAATTATSDDNPPNTLTGGRGRRAQFALPFTQGQLQTVRTITPTDGVTNYTLNLAAQPNTDTNTWSWRITLTVVQAGRTLLTVDTNGFTPTVLRNAQGTFTEGAAPMVMGQRTFTTTDFTNPIEIRILNQANSRRPQGIVISGYRLQGTGNTATYTLTNNSGQTLNDVLWRFGTVTAHNGAIANGASETHVFDTRAVRPWSVAFGAADSFGISGAGVTAATGVLFPGNANANAMANFFAGYVNNSVDDATATANGAIVTTRVRTTNTTPLVPAITTASGTAAVTNTVVENAGARFPSYAWQINDETGASFASGTYAPDGITDTASTIANEFATNIVTTVNALPNESGWTVSDETQQDGHRVRHVVVSRIDSTNYTLAIVPNLNDAANAGVNVGLGTPVDGDNNDVSFATGTAPDGDTLMLTALSGETIDAFLTRFSATITADTMGVDPNWAAAYAADTNTTTLTAVNGGVHDGVWSFEYTNGSVGDGDIAFDTAAVTTEGTDKTARIAFGLVTGDETYEFDTAETTANGVATDLATAITAATGVASATAVANVVNIVYSAEDFVVPFTDLNTVRDLPAADKIPSGYTFTFPDVTYTDNSANIEASDFVGAAVGPNQIDTTAVIRGHPALTQSVMTATLSFTDIVTNEVINTETRMITFASGATESVMINTIANELATRFTEFVDILSQDTESIQVSTRAFGTEVSLSIDLAFDRQTLQDNSDSYIRADAPIPTPEGRFTGVNDLERPWLTDIFNLARQVVILASSKEINGSGFGFTFGADPTADPAVPGTAYESYVERIHNPMDNEVEFTKHAESVQLLLSDGDVDVQLGMTDSPGDRRNLYVDENGTDVATRTFYHQEDYKVDWRRHGRLFNLRISDPTRIIDATTDEERDRTTDDAATGWRVAGYGMSIGREERRGGRRS